MPHPYLGEGEPFGTAAQREESDEGPGLSGATPEEKGSDAQSRYARAETDSGSALLREIEREVHRALG